MAKKPIDEKEQSKRSFQIVVLVLSLAGLGAYGYGHYMASPKYREALAHSDRAKTVHLEAYDKQKKERKGKKGADSPKVKAAADAMLVMDKEKEDAMLRVGLAAAATLVLGFIGFIVGLVALTKTKWSAAKLGKRLGQSVFAIACLLVGSAGLYLGIKLLAILG